MDQTNKLIKIYETLQQHYGPQHWWPAKTPFEVMVGAILTQNTNWTNVEKAITGLRSAANLSPEGILALDIAQLESAIRPSGYYRQKAQRLRGFCQYLVARYHGDPETMQDLETHKLRDELLELKGIGTETADSMLLYALNHPVFVIDAYTIRLFSRLGQINTDATCTEAQKLFMDHLEPDPAMFNEYHALIVGHCKLYCRKREPLCGECCLNDECQYSSGF